MKKLYRKLMVALMALAIIPFAASCNDDDDNDSSSNSADATFKEIAEQYVENTVVYTYSQLAANAEQLVDELETLKANKTQANLNAVATTFLQARHYWEMSEAFLFGPATSFGIDPHIDSWPLDQNRFNALMSNSNMLEQLSGDDADEVANGLEATLLGFHGLEYVIFKDKSDNSPLTDRVKSVADISDQMLTYAVAVAGDLRNCTYRLEVSWAGNDAPASHIAKLDELEWEYTVNGGSYSYADNMLRAGNAGSTYVSFSHVMQEIVKGCSDIADEVGAAKIGTAYNGEDEDYIESPYSKNSITDFRDNIISIQNAYMGGVEGVNRNERRSLHFYLQSTNATLDNKVTEAIDNAIDKIYNGMPKPFVDNIRDQRNKAAMDACAELVDVLEELYEYLGNLNE